MKWAPGDCRRGDMIRIRLGSFYHYGVFVSEDEVIQFGYPPLPEFREKNEHITVVSVGIDDFACGKIVEVPTLDRRERKSRRSVEDTVAFARERLGSDGYNIIHNNCEHFANECVFGERRSVQEDTVREFWKKMFGDKNR